MTAGCGVLLPRQQEGGNGTAELAATSAEERTIRAEGGHIIPDRSLGEALALPLFQDSCSPEQFPPYQSVPRWFARFRDDGLWQTTNHHLMALDCERMGREACPSATIMDSQSLTTTEAGTPRGFNAGKKVTAPSMV